MPPAVRRLQIAPSPSLPGANPADAPALPGTSLVQTDPVGRKYTTVAGLGTIALSRDPAVNNRKIAAIAERHNAAGTLLRDAMALQAIALQELVDLRSRSQLGALHSDENSALLNSLDQVIALSRQLLDEAPVFLWEQVAVTRRLAALRARLGVPI